MELKLGGEMLVGLRRCVAVAAAAMLAVALGVGGSVLSARTARADVSLAQTTVVGVHNTYNPDAYPYLAKALDAGASMVELDAWDDVFTREWKVSHDSLTSNKNNCVDASSPSDIYSGSANKDLGSCLDDIKYWLAAHPGKGPIYVKVELKAGFQNNYGMGPAAFDSEVNSHVGSVLYRPADLLGGYASLDEAARANAWPSRAALAGKIIMYVIPGTVELGNPTDTLHTDVEYATYLNNLRSAGRTATATTFPAVLGAASGDPRTQYADTSIRPWFVVFDGDAATYVNGVDTSWYDTNHYLLTMTDAHNVSPAIDQYDPPVPDAQARVAKLAADHATVVSCDWYGLSSVLSQVLNRGAASAS
ncbi:phosphatidylinositol-specific phospholipase C domain-containing protein [Actinoallomurus soli]|uniref:phosphatidylinositol-specific phospholipase C domain-containing protein n=1 Tax=Actinoallomurus soli TaxID=2952535 RepID=UPI002093C043|nr:phosphatidylinositol-specific phospholipase C domain-containing protein [Actinoallomurus soli]MCO5970077.1 Ca2+-dependent phosphoinositide-specific phospholipase C [Actinoallomurus soli]